MICRVCGDEMRRTSVAALLRLVERGGDFVSAARISGRSPLAESYFCLHGQRLIIAVARDAMSLRL